MNKDSSNLLNDLRKLLVSELNTTQEAICHALEARGHRVNQSKISRLLRKISAIKLSNDQGELVYRLPHDAAPPPLHVSLADLVLDLVANETTIIIKTSPGSASLIARILDQKKCQILGSIAGDDTIFIAPQSVETLEETLSLIRQSLQLE